MTDAELARSGPYGGERYGRELAGAGYPAQRVSLVDLLDLGPLGPLLDS